MREARRCERGGGELGGGRGMGVYRVGHGGRSGGLLTGHPSGSRLCRTAHVHSFWPRQNLLP
jgi:hypothetical protein